MAVHLLSNTSLLKLCSFLLWGLLYLHTALNWKEKDPEWSSRMITLLHGTIATIVGLSQCDIVNLSQWRLNMRTSNRHYALMLWSWGYFAFDFLWVLVYQPYDRLMIAHHLSAVVGISLYMHKEYTGCTFACNLAMLEVTNPLLQTRWFLKYEGYTKTTLFYLVEATYVVLFIIVRMVLGTCLVYKIIKSPFYDWDEKVISIVLYLVSGALVYQVMGYLNHRYGHKVWDYLDNKGIILKDLTLPYTPNI